MGIERRRAAAGTSASTANSAAARSKSCESALRFRGRVSSAIVRCFDLDVFSGSAAVAVVVLDSEIGELHVAVDAGQSIQNGPPFDFVFVTERLTLTVVTASVCFLQKPLVLSFEFVIQD